MKIAANLGHLWKDLPLDRAIRAAAAAGFEAVETQYPYAHDRAAAQQALAETGIPMLGVNVPPSAAGEPGMAAVPGREAEAREGILQAIDWARALGARHSHVMAGRASGEAAEATFRETLRWACGHAAQAGLTLVLEPLNDRDQPGYFLSTLDHAVRIIEDVGRPELGLMFDLYHVQVQEGDVLRRFERHLPIVRHVQFAGAPRRSPPDTGELALERVLPALRALGWEGWMAAEYGSPGPTDDFLGWLPLYKSL